MALLGPDSSQIAREVWVEQQGWRQEREYTRGGREPPLCHLSAVLPARGAVGASTAASLRSLNRQMLGAPWREMTSVFYSHIDYSGEI